MIDRKLTGIRNALTHHGTPLAQAVAAALGRSADDDLEEAERAGIAVIEARRAKLLKDASLVPGYPDLTVRNATAKASKNAHEARVIFLILRGQGALTGVELGANMGISGAYQALALQLNGGGQFISLEGSEGRAALARETVAPYDNTEIRVGQFDQTLELTLAELGELDYAFVDGNHRRDPTLEYFELILPRVRRPGVLLFDDIHHNPGMDEAWAVIAADPRVSLDCGPGPDRPVPH
ncbi:MAG: class I SAM-dependent methyltransferase [Tetrasphaera sp.]